MPNATPGVYLVSNLTLWEIHLLEFQHQWLQQSALNYFYVAVMTIFALLGTLANMIVIISLLVVPELHKIEYAFVGNLAAADMLVTGVVIPVNVLATLRGPTMFRDHPWFCELDGTICASACAGSIWCIMAISVERYICICHFSVYQKMFTPPRVAVMIICLWIIAHSIHLPNFIGWGHTSYSGDLYLCTAELGLWSYSVFYGMSAILVPIGISFYAYLKIYLRVRRSRAGRRHLTGNKSTTMPSAITDSDPVTNNPKTQIVTKAAVSNVQEEMKLLKALFKVFIMFLASWLMIGIFFVARAWVYFPKWYSYVGLILAHGSSATNSVVYFWMTDLMQTTKNGYIRLWKQVRRSRTQPQLF
ncbi:alpha-1A adrenergic receptor-like isoform X2 [Paramacrobiotus metropolitanus]|uniref:alpha-1A adrenergic receptor-like isoform X2 n=1 Tax=Paramacrobiotus metropolitanus TaxID=2943436 RepID=UPI002446212C|nr:alpha-1A adrenergic receptor-like isoform X2 [Paramacrobiotus metropolitanus]